MHPRPDWQPAMRHNGAHARGRLPNFERSVRALTDVAIHDRPGPIPSVDIADDVARFVLQVHARMPDHLRLALRLLTLLFDAWPYPTTGRPFHALDRAQRRARVRTWEQSRLGVRRSLIAFYKSFAIYGLYAELYGADARVENAA
jgi:hypothetical protein